MQLAHLCLVDPLVAFRPGPIAIYPSVAGGRSVAGSEMTVVNSLELTAV